MKCNKDCFNCPFPDCINDYVKPYDAEYHKRYWAEHSEEINKKRKLLHEERKANGICVCCGKRQISKNSTYQCTECMLKDRTRHIKRYKANGGSTHETFEMMGLCKKCGKEKPVEGYKLCKSCLEKDRQAMALGRSRRKKNSI